MPGPTVEEQVENDLSTILNNYIHVYVSKLSVFWPIAL